MGWEHEVPGTGEDPARCRLLHVHHLALLPFNSRVKCRWHYCNLNRFSTKLPRTAMTVKVLLTPVVS